MFPIFQQIETIDGILIVLAVLFVVCSHIVLFGIAHYLGFKKGLVARVESIDWTTQTVIYKKE